MILRRLNERFGTTAIVTLAVAILVITLGAWVATCTVERMYPSPKSRFGVTREIDTASCPLALEATRLCLGSGHAFSEMPTVGIESCTERLDYVSTVLERCSDGYISDEAAASMIHSLGSASRPRDEPISL